MGEWTDTTTTSVRDSLGEVIGFIPEIIAALVVILIGVIVAWAVKVVIVKGLSFIKLRKYTDSMGLSRVFTEKVEVAELIGDIAKWTIIIIFLIPALTILNLDGINDIIRDIVDYIPNVIVAVVILMVGVVAADLTARVVRSTAATIGARSAEMLADVARWAIVLFSVLAALVQLNIAAGLLQILWTGIVAFFVIAGGIAFGMGGKEAAADVISRARKNIPKK
jgi:hypothetical protein